MNVLPHATRFPTLWARINQTVGVSHEGALSMEINVSTYSVKFMLSNSVVLDVPRILFTEHSSIVLSGPHSVVERGYVADYVLLIDNLSNQPPPELRLPAPSIGDLMEGAKKAGAAMFQAIRDDGIGRLWEALITNAPANKTIQSAVLKGLRFMGSAPVSIVTGVLLDAKKTGDATLNTRDFKYQTSSGASVYVSVLGP